MWSRSLGGGGGGGEAFDVVVERGEGGFVFISGILIEGKGGEGWG